MFSYPKFVVTERFQQQNPKRECLFREDPISLRLPSVLRKLQHWPEHFLGYTSYIAHGLGQSETAEKLYIF